jgi:hypothetical protein
MSAARDMLTPHPVAEALLEGWRARLGPAHHAYANHAHRVFHLARRLGALDASLDEPLAITAAFHDVGIWLDDTFEYLAPSAARAAAHVQTVGHPEWAAMVTAAIEAHHKVTPWNGPNAAFVNAFRRADWLDVAMFALPTVLPRPFLRDLVRVFPRAGFHGRIVRIGLAWARRHPTRPLPMLRW